MEAVVEELISVVQLRPGRLHHHQGLLEEAQPAHVDGGAVGPRLADHLPRDGEVRLLRQTSVLEFPNVGAQTSLPPPLDLLERLLVVAQPLLPLSRAEAQVGLVLDLLLDRRPLLHLHRGLVNNVLLQALTSEWTRLCLSGPPRTGTIAPRPLGHHHSLAGQDLGVVAGDNPRQVGHAAVGDLDGSPVEDLAEGVGWPKVEVNQGEELAADAGGDRVAPWRVVPNDVVPLAPSPPPRRITTTTIYIYRTSVLHTDISFRFRPGGRRLKNFRFSRIFMSLW